MRSIDSTFTSEKNAQENQPVRLYTIWEYDGSNDLHFSEYDSNVTYDGTTYTAFPITFDIISENNQGSIDTVQVKVANVSRIIEAYIQANDLRGKKVTIKTVWANQLADTDAYIDDVFYIDSYQSDQQTVVFTLTSKFDLLEVQLPLRRYSRNYCQWKYKGTECGATSAQTTCNKTKQDCKARSNYERFGAFPSVRPSKVIVT